MMVGVVFRAAPALFYFVKKEEIKIISLSPCPYKFHSFFVSDKARP